VIAALYEWKIKNMPRMLDAIKKPKVWFIVCLVYIWLFGLGKLFATIGPPYLISRIANANNAFSISAIGKSFLYYTHEVANRLGYKYEYVLFAFVANIVIFMPIVILSYFVLRKNRWALNTMIILIAVYVVLSVGLGLLTSESVSGAQIMNTVMLVGVIYVFIRKSTKAIFNEKNI
jgi:hypothetical protein